MQAAEESKLKNTISILKQRVADKEAELMSVIRDFEAEKHRLNVICEELATEKESCASVFEAARASWDEHLVSLQAEMKNLGACEEKLKIALADLETKKALEQRVQELCVCEEQLKEALSEMDSLQKKEQVREGMEFSLYTCIRQSFWQAVGRGNILSSSEGRCVCACA